MSEQATEARRSGGLPRGRGSWLTIRDDADELYEVMAEPLSDGSLVVYRHRADKRTGQEFGDCYQIEPPPPVMHQPKCGLGHYGRSVSAETCVHGHETLQGTRL